MLLPGFCAAEDSLSPVLKLNPLVKDFLAGGLAGGLAIACTQPLDTVRVRLQQAVPSTVSAAGRSAAIYAPRAAPDAVSILRNLVRAEGITAPWKGMTAPLVMASVQSAILFQVYGLTLRYMAGSSEAQQTAAQQAQGQGTQQHSSQQQTAPQDSQQATTQAAHSHPNPTPYQGMVAGCVAGFAQVWLWSPVELVKVRMQLQSARKGTKGYVGPLALAQRIFKREGVAGLYRGVTATALRDIPSYGMYFGLYHVLLNALEGDIHPDEASPMTHVLAGGTAGLVSWLPVYHIDVIKTRMQATSRSGTPGKTWLDFAKQIYREEGARALLRGMPMTLARAFILDAVVFVAYRTSLKKMDHL